MKKNKLLALAAAASIAAAAAYADADEDAKLVISGEDGMEEMIVRTDPPAHLADTFDVIYSGWLFRTSETQALEMDDFDNPAMVLVDRAGDTFEAVDGGEGKSCASCHALEDFKGLRTKIPKINAEAEALWSMEDYVNNCRTTRMSAEPWKWSGDEMQGVVALISNQSRGMPMDVAIDGPAAEWWDRGKEMYYTRYGQLELSCANCHEDNYGRMIRADHLSQGQTNGFPTYRLKQAKLISQHNRFKGCIRDTIAHTFDEGSDEFRALELYVASRGNGLSVETPAVRQ